MRYDQLSCFKITNWQIQVVHEGVFAIRGKQFQIDLK